MVNSTSWKDNETRYLLDNFRNNTNREIASYLGRTIKSVGKKLLNMGLKRNYSEINYLIVKTNKGKKASIETRKKMSLQRIGKKNPKLSYILKQEYANGERINPYKGKHLSEEIKCKMRKQRSKEAKLNMSLSKIVLFKEGKLKMWNKGLTKETDERVKKQSEYLRGRKLTEETKKKISLSHLGKKNEKSSETKKRLFAEGKLIPWAKNKKFSIQHRLNLSKIRKGKSYEEIYGEDRGKELRKIFKNKSLGQHNNFYGKHHTLDSLKKISIKAKERMNNKINHPMFGKEHKEESINKMKISHINLLKNNSDIIKKTRIKIIENAKRNTNFGMKGKKHSIKTKELIKQIRANQIFPLKDTKIEIKIQNFLKQLGIEFFTHQYMEEIEHSYQCDILVPSMNLVIECDGDYWHKYPIGNEIDHIRTSELINKGFKVLRLWEHEIKSMDLTKFNKKLSEY